MDDEVSTRNKVSTRIKLRNDPNVGSKYPLHLVTEEQVREFCTTRDLPIEVDVLVRGFLAFRHRAYIEEQFGTIEDAKGDDPSSLIIGEYEFTNKELQTLWKFWRRGKWQTLRHMSRLHWLLIFGCIFAAMTQGWDQAAMAGAIVQAMKAFHRSVSPTQPGGSSKSDSNTDDVNLDANTWLLGFLVGIPFLFGAPIGLLITDRLTEIWTFGRRGAICVASLFSFISVVGSASVHNVNDFIGFRILLGAGMAGKASIVPIILSETSAKNVRGVLLVFWQLSVAFGLAAGSVANLSVYHLNVEQSWRYMFIAAFIPALLLFSLVLFAPESPRWLLKKSGLGSRPSKKDKDNSNKRVQDALRSLIELHNEPTNILAAGELILLYTRLVREQEHFADRDQNNDPLGTAIAHVTWRYRWKLMISKGPMRRANYAAAAVMIAQQACGINLLAFLADNFFRNSFFRQTDPTSGQNSQLLAFSLGFGLWNFVATIPALFFIDNSNDRRRLLNWSFPLMSISLLISGLILLSPSKTIVDGAQEHHEVYPVVAAMHYIFLATFIAAYSVGEGPAAFVISAEVFPLVNRELGMSLAVFWNFLFAGLLALLAPALTKYITQTGILGLFAGLNLIAWAFCQWLVPNTGNEELEDVFRQFDVPTRFALVYTLVKWSDKVRKTMSFLFCLGRHHDEEAVISFGDRLRTVDREWQKYHPDGNEHFSSRDAWRFLKRKPREQPREQPRGQAQEQGEEMHDVRHG